MKLPKNIIAKYGISKKAWQVFRNQNGSTQRALIKKGKRKITRRKHMAKKKQYSRKASMPTWAKDLLTAAGSGAYGYGRNLVSPKVPQVLGNYTNEALFGGLAILGTLSGNKYVKAVSRPILAIEAGTAGAKLQAGVPIGSISMSAPTANSNSGVVFY